MNEIVDSVKQVVKERLSSTMYGVFFISWCVWNWKALYVSFFISESSIWNIVHQLKIDYLLSFYKSDSILSFLWILTKLLIGPFSSAIFIVWVLSLVEFAFFRKNTINRLKKKERSI